MLHRTTHTCTLTHSYTHLIAQQSLIFLSLHLIQQLLHCLLPHTSLKEVGGGRWGWGVSSECFTTRWESAVCRCLPTPPQTSPTTCHTTLHHSTPADVLADWDRDSGWVLLCIAVWFDSLCGGFLHVRCWIRSVRGWILTGRFLK